MSEANVWNDTDAYIAGLLIGEDEALNKALEANREAGLPAIDVAPNQGKLLHLLARMQGAKRILEIGALGGYSTIWLSRALPEGGSLLSLEINPRHAEVARSNLARAGLNGIAEIRVGHALETLAQLEREGVEPFDFIFIDADKANIPNYVRWALRFSRPGSVIVCDNVVRDGKILNAASEDENVIGVRTMFEMLAAEKKLSATAVQTVGIKGYDGFMIGIVE